MIPKIQHAGSLRERIASAYQQACEVELDALKPGNVHRYANGHAMTAEDFLTSARVSAGPLTEPGLGLGERIYRSVAATREAVGCNTNLGILLLCAPLVQTLLDERPATALLRERLYHVLRQAGVEDTRWLFHAIALAAPGGLGQSDKHDVSGPPTAGLREVMAHAAGRDRIAFQYTTGYADLFGFALPRLRFFEERWHSRKWAAAGLFLSLLASFPDTHIQRKYGRSKAVEISRRAAALSQGLLHADQPETYHQHLLQADTEFKREGINPGTTADLTVASLFLLVLQRTCPSLVRNAGFSRNCESLPAEGWVHL